MGPKTNLKESYTETTQRLCKTCRHVEIHNKSAMGSDQYSTTKIYQIYIRSKLDYGSPVYSSAAKMTLAMLDSITNECLRIAAGAFKTTPTETLHVIANEISPQRRRQYLSFWYYYKMKSSIGNLAHSHVISLHRRMMFQNKGIAKPLHQRVQAMITDYSLRKLYITPEFSYQFLNITQHVWTLTPLRINLEVAKVSKETTPQAYYRQAYSKLCQDEYSDKVRVCTDGSKRAEGIGAAVV